MESMHRKEQLVQQCIEELMSFAGTAQDANIAPARQVEPPMPTVNFRIRLPLSRPWTAEASTSRPVLALEAPPVADTEEDDDDFMWLDSLNENELEREIKLIPIMLPNSVVKEEVPEVPEIPEVPEVPEVSAVVPPQAQDVRAPVEKVALPVMLNNDSSEGLCVKLEIFQAPSPADSGVGSPPLHVDQVELIYKDRKCLCGKPASYICKCTYAVYCSDVCQVINYLSSCLIV